MKDLNIMFEFLGYVFFFGVIAIVLGYLFWLWIIKKDEKPSVPLDDYMISVVKMINAMNELAITIQKSKQTKIHKFPSGGIEPGSRKDNKIYALENELKVTEDLLADRQRLLDAIPECKTHGKCVPHALDWIKEAKEKLKCK